MRAASIEGICDFRITRLLGSSVCRSPFQLSIYSLHLHSVSKSVTFPVRSTCMAISVDGSEVSVGFEDGTVGFFSCQDLSLNAEVRLSTGRVSAILLRACGDLVCATWSDGLIFADRKNRVFAVGCESISSPLKFLVESKDGKSIFGASRHELVLFEPQTRSYRLCFNSRLRIRGLGLGGGSSDSPVVFTRVSSFQLEPGSFRITGRVRNPGELSSGAVLGSLVLLGCRGGQAFIFIQPGAAVELLPLQGKIKRVEIGLGPVVYLCGAGQFRYDRLKNRELSYGKAQPVLFSLEKRVLRPPRAFEPRPPKPPRVDLLLLFQKIKKAIEDEEPETHIGSFSKGECFAQREGGESWVLRGRGVGEVKVKLEPRNLLAADLQEKIQATINCRNSQLN